MKVLMRVCTQHLKQWIFRSYLLTGKLPQRVANFSLLRKIRVSRSSLGLESLTSCSEDLRTPEEALGIGRPESIAHTMFRQRDARQDSLSLNTGGQHQKKVLSILVISVFTLTGCEASPSKTQMVSSASRPIHTVVSDYQHDQWINQARVDLLAKLKKAKTHRVAYRDQYPDWEEKTYGYRTRLLRFDSDRLHDFCERTATALFTEQHRIGPLPAPTASVRRDGVVKVKEVINSFYPDCRTLPEYNLHTPPEAWRSRIVADLRKTPLLDGLRVYRLDGGGLILEPGKSKLGPEIRAKLIVGSGQCPTREEGATVRVGKGAEVFGPAGLMTIDQQTAVVRFEPNFQHLITRISVLDFYRDKDEKDPEQSFVNSVRWRFESYPDDAPDADESVLNVYVPPYSPVTPPIAQTDYDWDPAMPVDPYADDEEQNNPYSFPPTCIVYYK